MNSYLPIARTSHRVHIQMETGNITDGTTHAVVVFRSSDGSAIEDSLHVLQAAGGDVEAEYQMVKAQGGRHVSKGVVLTGSGKLKHPRHISHLHIDKENPWKLTETLISGLRLADNKGIKSIAFPSLPGPLHSELMIGRMLVRRVY